MAGGPAVIRHPRELRAIPNNAILQQLGWCANTLQGLGAAAARHPRSSPTAGASPRFRRALDFAAHALAHSDLDVLRAVIGMLDPGRLAGPRRPCPPPGPGRALMAVAGALERLDLWAPAQAMFRRIQADHLACATPGPTRRSMADRGGPAARAAAGADPAASGCWRRRSPNFPPGTG